MFSGEIPATQRREREKKVKEIKLLREDIQKSSEELNFTKRPGYDTREMSEKTDIYMSKLEQLLSPFPSTSFLSIET